MHVFQCVRGFARGGKLSLGGGGGGESQGSPPSVSNPGLYSQILVTINLQVSAQQPLATFGVNPATENTFRETPVSSTGKIMKRVLYTKLSFVN